MAVIKELDLVAFHAHLDRSCHVDVLLWKRQQWNSQVSVFFLILSVNTSRVDCSNKHHHNSVTGRKQKETERTGRVDRGVGGEDGRRRKQCFCTMCVNILDRWEALIEGNGEKGRQEEGWVQGTRKLCFDNLIVSLLFHPACREKRAKERNI